MLFATDSERRYYNERDYHEDKPDRFQVRSGSNDRKSANDRYSREEYSTANERQSSPRYSHKLPYLDRIKLDKDRPKYNREQDGFVKEDSRFHDKRRNAANLSKNPIENNRSLENMNDDNVDKRRLKEVDSSGKHEERKTASTSEKKSNTGQTKDPRVEAQKTALRICGDWSEHVSSSGKKYFYNCKTEVSQWVKPKEWKVADEQAKQDSGKVIASLSNTHKSTEVLSHNGSTSSACLHSNNHKYDSKPSHRSDSAERIPKAESDKRQSLINDRTDSHGTNRINSSHRQQTKNSNYSNHQRHHQKQRNNEHSSSAASSPSSSGMDIASPNVNNSTDRMSRVRRQEHAVCQQAMESQETNGVSLFAGGSGDDMDISPDGSPKPAVVPNSYTKCAEKLGSARVKAAEPRSSESRVSQGSVQNNESAEQNMIWGKALETLQTLQEVLERSRGAGNPSAANSSHAIDSPTSGASQSPRVIPLSAQSERIVESKITSESSEKSPTLSEVSLGQTSVLSTATSDSTLATAASSLTVLPQSLINYYDSSLIGHISNWPAEQLELRAHMAYKDGLVICGHHCGQVSTELKRDRSQVRIAEVQSTLIEHRYKLLLSGRADVARFCQFSE